jgi:hypothetical protein
MGQVPTLVKGKVNVGDYIVPCGENDGFAVGIAPEDITIDDIPKIAGKAWEATDNDTYDMINVAIGLSTGEMAVIMKKQQEKMLVQTQKIKELEVRLSDLENAPLVQGKKQVNTVSVDKYNELMERLEILEVSLGVQAQK